MQNIWHHEQREAWRGWAETGEETRLRWATQILHCGISWWRRRERKTTKKKNAHVTKSGAGERGGAETDGGKPESTAERTRGVPQTDASTNLRGLLSKPPRWSTRIWSAFLLLRSKGSYVNRIKAGSDIQYGTSRGEQPLLLLAVLVRPVSSQQWRHIERKSQTCGDLLQPWDLCTSDMKMKYKMKKKKASANQKYTHKVFFYRLNISMKTGFNLILKKKKER